MKKCLESLKVVRNSGKYELKDIEVLALRVRELRKKVKEKKQMEECTELMIQINIVGNVIQKKEIQDCCLANQKELKRDELYRFVLEDREGSKQVKYFAISNLDNPSLNFVHIKFKK